MIEDEQGQLYSIGVMQALQVPVTVNRFRMQIGAASSWAALRTLQRLKRKGYLTSRMACVYSLTPEGIKAARLP